jgi:hypothetical protein
MHNILSAPCVVVVFLLTRPWAAPPHHRASSSHASTELITGRPVLDEATTPRRAVWAARFYAHEAVGDLVPDARRLVEFIL